MTLTMMMMGSGPAERYIWSSSYPSNRPDLWIMIHQCVVMMMTSLTTLFLFFF